MNIDTHQLEDVPHFLGWLLLLWTALLEGACCRKASHIEISV